ncbi:aldehyde dehydrogenase family protein, partial [Rhizobium ruizarguesonis]
MSTRSSVTNVEPAGSPRPFTTLNTPIANIAWKNFPALICGNTVVQKAAEDSPRIAQLFAELT